MVTARLCAKPDETDCDRTKGRATWHGYALVTGGTRGIGEAISVAMQAAGCQVVANYGGNDEAASRFKEKTGIPVYKWDVADFQACQDGIAQVQADLGPIDVLVNNAGSRATPPCIA